MDLQVIEMLLAQRYLFTGFFFDSRAPTALQSGNIIKFLSGWGRKCHAFESNLVI